MGGSVRVHTRKTYVPTSTHTNVIHIYLRTYIQKRFCKIKSPVESIHIIQMSIYASSNHTVTHKHIHIMWARTDSHRQNIIYVYLKWQLLKETNARDSIFIKKHWHQWPADSWDSKPYCRLLNWRPFVGYFLFFSYIQTLSSFIRMNYLYCIRLSMG